MIGHDTFTTTPRDHLGGHTTPLQLINQRPQQWGHSFFYSIHQWENTQDESLTIKRSKSAPAKICIICAMRTETRSFATKVSGFGCRWRLPHPSEDKILPGEYADPYFRGDGRIPLTRANVVGDNGEDETIIFEPKKEVVEHPGSMQIHHQSGLLINLKCYHGIKLPEAGGDVSSIHWNGKTSHWWDLVCLRETEEGLHPVVQCRVCGHMYRETWSAVLDFIRDEELKRRLMSYAITLSV